MKVTSKKSQGNKVVLDIEIAKDAITKKFDEIYTKIGQEAKIPGFRPGKAPRHVVEQHHAKEAREEVLKHLITESYQATLKEEAIDVVDVPEISDVKFDQELLSYKAQVEVKPDIKIKQYKGLKIKKSEINVEASEIDDQVKKLLEARDKDTTEERLAKSLGYRSKEEFVDCLTKQKYLQKENEERARLERDLIQQLVQQSNFGVPVSLVERRAHELHHQAEYQMANYGIPEEKIKERLKEFEPKFKTEAEEQVKVFLILEKIAKLEQIKSDDHMANRVVELLFAEAQWT
ncbi:MAG: trigger factor [Candidatus Omnitrophota bacterium]